METEVLSVNGSFMVVRCGLYDITFEKTPDGKVVKRGFTLWKSNMESSYIPPEVFNPAIKRARAVFSGKNKQLQRNSRCQTSLF